MPKKSLLRGGNASRAYIIAESAQRSQYFTRFGGCLASQTLTQERGSGELHQTLSLVACETRHSASVDFENLSKFSSCK